jgi:hypothetical protein
MAIRNEFLRRNAVATRFGNLDLASSACTLASRLLPNSPLSCLLPSDKSQQSRLKLGLPSQRLIPTGEQSGLQMRIAVTESVTLCMRMKS